MDDKTFIHKAYFHAWNLVFDGSPKPFWNLLKNIPDIKYAWEEASIAELKEANLSKFHIQKFLNLRKEHNLFQSLKDLEKNNIQIIIYRDPEYPPQLRLLNSHFSPVVLYIKGKIPSQLSSYLSIVGTRQMTGYGESVTRHIVKTLSRYNIVIVSGMAYGIDSVAHQAAIECKLPTIAVLGYGLNKIPHHMHKFAKKIIENGALISEYPPSYSAQKYTFPLRNRIISGLSKVTVIVEAGEKSGACITAKYALDQSREVFAVPGSIYSEKSIGTNKLLKDSIAHPLCQPEDLLEQLGLERQKRSLNSFITPEQTKIVDILKQGPISLDDLKYKSSLPSSRLVSALTELELNDFIQKNKNGKYFLR
jgi:DNA processing protein